MQIALAIVYHFLIDNGLQDNGKPYRKLLPVQVEAVWTILVGLVKVIVVYIYLVYARTVNGIPNAVEGGAACAQNGRDRQNEQHNHHDASGRP